MKNELFALHWNGELLQPDVWKKYSDRYGNNWLYGWRPPKKIYYTKGMAKSGRSHLPEAIRDEVKIVRYEPVEEVE
jgi:hypothetical protein